jgi:hypothetical protein
MQLFPAAHVPKKHVDIADLLVNTSNVPPADVSKHLRGKCIRVLQAPVINKAATKGGNGMHESLKREGVENHMEDDHRANHFSTLTSLVIFVIPLLPCQRWGLLNEGRAQDRICPFDADQ